MWWTPRLARFVSWCLAIALHELLFILALWIQSEKTEIVSLRPDLYTAMVPDRTTVVEADPIASPPVWAGRWPLDCDHRALLRMPSDQIVADTRCDVCQWPWWVLRASLRE
jgi:hypothetical protein